jgi:hypothetical protein
MNRPNLLTAVALLSVALASGCAGGGAGTASSSPADLFAGGNVELNVWNRSDRVLIAFARWGSSPRVRLGQLSAGRRGSYVTDVRGPTVAISWDVVSGTPPPATAGAGAPFPAVADGTGSPQCEISVGPGDRIEWTIASSGQSCSSVRLDPGAD